MRADSKDMNQCHEDILGVHGKQVSTKKFGLKVRIMSRMSRLPQILPRVDKSTERHQKVVFLA